MAQSSIGSLSCSGGIQPSQIFERAYRAQATAKCPGDEMLLIRRYKNVLARKLLEQGYWLTKISYQNINRITGDPCRKINGLIHPGVKTDQQPTLLAPDVFNRMSISLWDVSDIAGVQLFRPKSTVRAKHRHGRSPSIIYCHSSAFGCQWSSRQAPGLRSRTTPVIVVETGNRLESIRHSRPPSKTACGAPASIRNLCVSGGETLGPCRFSGICPGGTLPRAK